MVKFKDVNGKEWSFAIVYGQAVKQLKDELNFDVYVYGNSPTELAKIYDFDYPRMVELTYFLCGKEIEKAKITPEEWANHFDGPALEGAVQALADAVSGFFPRNGMLKAVSVYVRSLIEKATTEREKAVQNFLTNPESSIVESG